MKKYFTFAIVSLLLFAGIPTFAAAEGLQVVINGNPVTFTDAKPYVSGGTAMLPIRATAAELNMKVAFDQASKEIQLSGEGIRIAFKSGSAKASRNGVEVSYGMASLTKHNRVYVPLSFFKVVLGYESVYDADKKEVSIASAPETSDPVKMAGKVIALLTAGKNQQLSDQFFDNQLQKAVSVEQLNKTWEEVGKAAGKYVATQSIDSAASDANTTVVTAKLQFEKLSFTLTLTIGSNHKMTGILLRPLSIEEPAPSGVKEEKVVVGKDTPFPLGGTLTMPKNSVGPLPAVVLVQGSGPSDRDETAAAYKPFRDIAWGLAQQGIAVLRYDKRTYVYPGAFKTETAAKMTVKEETVDDAIAASKLLKSDSRIDPARVFLIGHSQGGMLAPRIDADGGNFSGIIVLAGTPRTLWELIYDQNVDLIKTMKDTDPAKAANEALLQAEYDKAKKISGLTDEEAMKTTVFGLPAYYFKEMDAHGAAEYAAKLNKPIYILQGQNDFQVYADKDYGAWQKLFDGKPNAAFKLYPGLNHFFVHYSGEGEGTLDEYKHPGNVSPDVIRDVADWILKR